MSSPSEATNNPALVACYESDRSVRTQIFDPHGNAMTMGEIVDLVNTQAADRAATTALVEAAIAWCRAIDAMESADDLPGLTDEERSERLDVLQDEEVEAADNVFRQCREVYEASRTKGEEVGS